MIAVCCSEKCGLPEFFSKLFRSEDRVGKLAYISVGLFGNVVCHGEGAAQYLEGIQAEAVGFVFYKESSKTQIFGHVVKLCKRCFAVLRKAFVKGPGLCYIFQ